MATAETARLIVDLSLKGNFVRQLGAGQRALGKFDAKLDQTETRAFRAGQQIGTGIKRAAGIAAIGVGILASQVVVGLDSLVKLEAQTDITNAAIKSTKGVAGITAEAVRKMAEEFESVNALFGDEVIQSAANMLLAFTNIRKKAFKPTLQAVLDLNAGLGKSPDGLAGTAKLLGIALNDPTKGLGRLSRAGVTFTAEQIKRIKGLQKEGKLYEAQAIILGEVEKRFGGRGAAFGGETARKVAKFRDVIEDLQRTMAVGLLPAVSNIADALSDLFQDPAIQKGVADFGKDLAAFLTPARIKGAIADIKGLATTIAPAFGAAASAIGTVITAFGKLPPDLRNLLVGAFAVNKLTGGLVTNVAGGLASAIGSALKTIVAGHVTVVGKTVGLPGGGGAPGGAPGGGSGILGKALALGIAGAIVAAAVPIGQAFAGALPAELKGPGGRGESESQRRITEARDAINKRIPEATTAINAMKQSTNERIIGTTNSIDRMKAAAGTQSATEKATIRAEGAISRNTTRSSALTAAAIQAGATRAGTSAIVGAIFAARPQINVTQVTRSQTIVQRYGPGGTSSSGRPHDLI